MKRLRRWLWGSTRAKASVLVISLAAGAVSAAVVTTTASAVTGSPSGFESSDGNMVLDNTSGGSTDWNCFAGASNTSGFSTSVPSPTGCAVTTGASAITADQSGEVTWVNGQKFDTQCPALQTGSVPNKDDFTNVAEFQETDASGNLFFYGGAIRQTANGNASGDVEFNQNKGDGSTTAGCRTAGDRLLAYDFLNGGTSMTFHVLTWIDSAHSTLGGNSGKCNVKTDSMPCWGANVVTVATNLFDGEANQAAITAANNGISNAALVADQFSEFGINLTQALGGGALPCFPQQVWESRSSGSSFSSNPEDIEFASLSTCGTVTIIKHTSPRGLNQSFSYSTTGGLTPSTFSLNDNGNSTSDSTGNTQTYSDVKAGTYTVTEGAEPAAFAFGSISCTNNGVTAQNTAVLGQTVTITLASNDNVICTFVNNQQLGAIKVTKTDTKTPGNALSGAVFDICAGTPCVAVGTVETGTGTSSTSVTTGTSGIVCVDNLPFGTYSVTETTAPTGYQLPSTTTQSVTVNTDAACSDSPFAGNSATFTDAPLTNLTVSVASQATSPNPGTKSNISCTNGTTGTSNSPQPPDVQGHTQFASSPTLSQTGTSGLTPGTYTCTIIIDP